MARRAHIYDTVKLTRDVDGRPAGAIGAVVSERPGSALVEFVSDHRVDAEGFPMHELLDDLVTVPYALLHVVEPVSVASG